MKTILKKYSLIFLLVIVGVFSSFNTTFKNTIRSKLDYFTVDNLGNVYLIKEDELVKYLPNQKFFARYSNLKLGNITSVDATNPLKLVLYYRDFQQIVFLDNQLSVNSENVSLEKLGHEQTELVCASANNSFWIYDKQNNELLRFNENSRQVASTGNLKQVLRTDLKPDFITEHNGYLYLNCPENGIYVFDIFGAYSKLIALPNLGQFQAVDDLIYFKKDSLFCSYNHKLFEEACEIVPGSGKALGLKLINRRLYIGYKDSVKVLNK